MPPDKSSVQRLKWLGVMFVLFASSVWIVSQNNSQVLEGQVLAPTEAYNEISSDRLERERKIEADVEVLDEGLERLKLDLRQSRILSHRRKELRKLQRDLYAERRSIRQQLRDLRGASSADWEHLADHLEAELEKTKQRLKYPVKG